jgi:hypothetical protein
MKTRSNRLAGKRSEDMKQGPEDTRCTPTSAASPASGNYLEAKTSCDPVSVSGAGRVPGYVEAIDIVSILQAKACKLLAGRGV